MLLNEIKYDKIYSREEVLSLRCSLNKIFGIFQNLKKLYTACAL